MGWFKKHVVAIKRDEDGAISIEFVLWTPMIVALLLLVTDASAALMTRAEMWRTAGDVSRAIATGRVHPDDARSFVAENEG